MPDDQEPPSESLSTRTGEFSASPPSIDHSANLLIEIAGFLHRGRLDRDTATTARSPYADPEVGRHVLEFSTFADDQYSDLVELLTALSTKLSATGWDYVRADEQSQAELDRILSQGYYVAPQDR